MNTLQQNQTTKGEVSKTSVFDDAVRIKELEQDMYDLMSLGAYDKVIMLSRKYGFFNSYDVLVPTLIYHGEYDLAEEALHDILAGPLFFSVQQSLDSGHFGEFLYIPRLMYLIDYIKTHYYLQESDPFTRLFLDHFYNSTSFQKFVDRIEDELQSRGDEEHAIKMLDTAMRYGVMFGKKFESYCERNPKQFIFEQTQRTLENPDHHHEVRKYELLTTCHGGVCTKHLSNPALIATALNNISDYVYGEAPEQYENSLLKLDFQTIYGNIDSEEVIDLAFKAGVYEVLLLEALESYAAYDLDKTLKYIKTILSTPLTILTGKRFTEVAIRELVWQFTLHVLSHAGQEQRNQYEATFSNLLPSRYAEKIKHLHMTDEILYPHVYTEFNQMAKHLFENSKLIMRTYD